MCSLNGTAGGFVVSFTLSVLLFWVFWKWISLSTLTLPASVSKSSKEMILWILILWHAYSCIDTALWLSTAALALCLKFSLFWHQWLTSAVRVMVAVIRCVHISHTGSTNVNVTLNMYLTLITITVCVSRGQEGVDNSVAVLLRPLLLFWKIVFWEQSRPFLTERLPCIATYNNCVVHVLCACCPSP